MHTLAVEKGDAHSPLIVAYEVDAAPDLCRVWGREHATAYGG